MIQLDDVSMTFRSRGRAAVTALEGIDLRVEDGEFVALVGPSGCGKSTILKLVSGLLAPSGGQVTVGGKAVGGPRRDVGLVFQAPVLLPWRTVRENVLLPIEMLGLPVRDHAARADELLATVGLSEFHRARPWELSGGMQQRVGICRGLIHDPAILLMDEPFSALDAMTREELGVELLRIWEERRKTVLFVTHSITEAVLLSDRVIVMSPRPGRIVGEVMITVPRPRNVEQEYDAEFRDAALAIRHMIATGAPVHGR
jgi:NitT/TauT family transport system ATP-binding protein